MWKRYGEGFAGLRAAQVRGETTGKNRMRLLFVILFSGLAALGQPFSIGVRAGVPITNLFDGMGTARYPYTSITNRYLIGPTAELRLPLGFAVEFDALYRHYSYESPGFRPAPGIQLVNGLEQVTGGAWEFPLLAKYHFPSKIVRPYLDTGIAWNKIAGLNALTCAINCGHTSSPPSLRRATVTGFVAGAGIDAHFWFVHVSPEIRYTRWGGQAFQSPNGGFGSTQSQVEVMLGITR